MTALVLRDGKRTLRHTPGPVVALTLAQAQQAQGQDGADLDAALGGGEMVRVEWV